MDMSRLKMLIFLAALTVFVVSCSPTASPAIPTNRPGVIPSVVPTVVVGNTPTPSQNGLPQTEAEVPRVPLDDAVAAIQSGEAVVVDVRSAQAYQASHIPGALSIPLADIETNPSGINLDKDKWIITYCT